MVLLLVFMQRMRDLFAIAKFLFYIDRMLDNYVTTVQICRASSSNYLNIEERESNGTGSRNTHDIHLVVLNRLVVAVEQFLGRTNALGKFRRQIVIPFYNCSSCIRWAFVIALPQVAKMLLEQTREQTIRQL